MDQPTYTLTGFATQEIGFILEAISKVPAPLIVSRPVYDKIVAQLQDQDAKAEAKAKAEGKAKLSVPQGQGDGTAPNDPQPPAPTEQPANT
ncbi:MAG TPA: hypothetical protein VFX23_10900 [Limnobacter sp.]|uniref:hypothetical protein n=1 Tax=Limnobacter sp. TaxID=2003368 RepID=UPI002E372F18|nr:hypothetical protein [Limnobacter sp.]HEX5486492.1 hypothetical protein [Limnobacter sp.]